MSARNLASFINNGSDILSTEVSSNGMVLAQIGDCVGNYVEGNDSEFWQHVGFCSRPSAANAGKSACQALAMEQGSSDIVFATRDTRVGKIYGDLKPGETCLYAAGPDATEIGTGRVLLKDDGTTSTVSILTQKDNSESGVPVIIQVSSEGKVIINAGENGAITIDADGIKIVSAKDVQIGASENVTLIGQSLALNGANVSLGANATDTVAKATNTLQYINYLEAAMATFHLALNGGAFTPTPLPTTPPLIAALVAALAPFNPAVNPGILDTIAGIPSTSVFTA